MPSRAIIGGRRLIPQLREGCCAPNRDAMRRRDEIRQGPEEPAIAHVDTGENRTMQDSRLLLANVDDAAEGRYLQSGLPTALGSENAVPGWEERPRSRSTGNQLKLVVQFSAYRFGIEFE